MTNEQIRQRIEDEFDLPFNKWSWILPSSLLPLPMLLLFLSGVPVRSEAATQLAWGIGLLNFAWSVVVFVLHRDLPLQQQWELLSPESQRDWHHQNTMWFRLWKGIFLFFLSITCLLTSWRVLGFPGLSSTGTWSLGLFLLSFALSFFSRHRMLRLKIEGLRNSRWSRLIVRLSAGLITGAAVGSFLGRVVARVFPKELVLYIVGIGLFVVSVAVVPQVVYDCAIAGIHLRAKRRVSKC